MAPLGFSCAKALLATGLLLLCLGEHRGRGWA